MQLQRQYFLLSYFKTLSVGLAGVELSTSWVTARETLIVGVEFFQQRKLILCCLSHSYRDAAWGFVRRDLYVRANPAIGRFQHLT